MYKVGWCAEIQGVHAVKENGYDFIECALVSLCLEDAEAYRKVMPDYRNSALPLWAFNGFFPGDLKVVGEAIDKARIRNYVARATEALHTVGAKIAVLGSGGARRIPEGWEYARAEEQFLELLQLISAHFKGTGVTLAIEPLNKRECNFINRVSEGVKLAALVNQPEIRVLADFYHMQEEGETVDAIMEHKAWLAHIHLADTGRKSPGTGFYPYAALAEQLKNSGYEGMLSVECLSSDPTVELPQSRSYIETVFNDKLAEK